MSELGIKELYGCSGTTKKNRLAMHTCEVDHFAETAERERDSVRQVQVQVRVHVMRIVRGSSRVASGGECDRLRCLVRLRLGLRRLEPEVDAALFRRRHRRRRVLAGAVCDGRQETRLRLLIAWLLLCLWRAGSDGVEIARDCDAGGRWSVQAGYRGLALVRERDRPAHRFELRGLHLRAVHASHLPHDRQRLVNAPERQKPSRRLVEKPEAGERCWHS